LKWMVVWTLILRESATSAARVRFPSPSIEVCSAVARILAVEPLQTGTSEDVPRASWMLLQAFEVGGSSGGNGSIN